MSRKFGNKRRGSRRVSNSNRSRTGYTSSATNATFGPGSTMWGRPGKPRKEGTIKDHLSIVSLRGLPKSAWSMQANPNEAALPAARPYPLLAEFNKFINGVFAGEDNIDGGNVQQYASSIKSKFLAYADCGRFKIKLNYRYLPFHTTTADIVGSALVDEVRKSISETTSLLKSTTFTNLAINDFVVVTDMNMGSAVARNVAPEGETEILAYTSLTDVIFAMSEVYQVTLQEIHSFFMWFNAFRRKQGKLIRNAWNRESALLNALFGLLNKQSFTNLLLSISLSFEGEYFDKDFADQVADTCFIPSRRSDSITDPMIEIQPAFNHPSTFKVYVTDSNGQISDADSQLVFDLFAFSIPDPTSTATPRPTLNIFEICDRAKTMVSATHVATWARQEYNEGASADDNNDNDEFNLIKIYTSAITKFFSDFKPKWADFRECFDTMVRTGTITWQKGYAPIVTKETDSISVRNMAVENILNSIMGGPDTLDFSPATKRWRGYSKWNMYDGIPAYDIKQGGFFIAVSAKELSGDTANEETPYLPVAFTPAYIEGSNTCSLEMVTRNGQTILVDYNTQKISETRTLGRLVPLPSQKDITMRIPRVSISDNPTLSVDAKDCIYKTLCSIFGVAAVEYSAGNSSTYDVAVDPDLVAIYQIEYSDITNVASAYARAYAPFRGTHTDEGILGYWGMGASRAS